jgi:hypothetical protein
MREAGKNCLDLAISPEHLMGTSKILAPLGISDRNMILTNMRGW